MKFHTLGQKHGQSIKDQIVKRFREIGFISLGEVKEIAGDFALRDDKYTGWDDESDLDRRIRVRETKKGWFVYLPEPNAKILVGSDPVIIENPETKNLFEEIIEAENVYNMQLRDYSKKELEAIDNIRLSIDGMVDRIIERWMHYEVDVFTGFEKLGEVIGGHYGYFYRPCIVKAKKSGRKEERQDRNAKFHRWVDLSKGVQQVVALVEFEDGHVEQVQPDRIIFKEEE